MAKEVVEKTEQLPASVDLYAELEQSAGEGFDNVKATDLAIPYYTILQALSPQVKKGPQRIEGAEEGDIYNTVTGEVIKEKVGLDVIPCFYMKRYVEWVSRDEGGGFVAQHTEMPKEAELVEDSNGKRKNVMPGGTEIVETAYFFIQRIKDTGQLENAIISMQSTQLKNARRWLKTQMDFVTKLPNGKVINVPSFGQIFHLTSKTESKGNNSWGGWDISAPKLVEDAAIFKAAKEFHAFMRDTNPSFVPQEQEPAPATDDFDAF